jgi:cell division protein FtsL
MGKKESAIKRGNTVAIAGIVLLLLFIGELFVSAWISVECISVGYDINRLNKEYREHLAMRKNLEIEIALLKSPQRIAESTAARQQLKMPTPEQIISIP